MTPAFLPGLELSRRFYAEAVRPVLGARFPALRHSAARIGPGSEVLGYDTERSADHEWGPRLQLFLSAEDAARVGADVVAVLSRELPLTFLGWSTHFEPAGAAVGSMAPADGPVRHRVEVTDLGTWAEGVLGVDPRGELTTLDWLAVPAQRLAEVTGGAVFTDGLGELGPARERLAWYPPDVWRFLLAGQWQRIAQEEPLPGRCAEVGDELGSRLVTARLVRELVRLALLQERTYAPYGKWLGTAFARSPAAARLGPALSAALAAGDWPEREDALCAAYRAVAVRHGELGLTGPLDPEPRRFHDRPFRVSDGGRFARALQAATTDARLAAAPPLGGIDQLTDSVDVLMSPQRCRALVVAALG